jgi:hypothetical protein
MYAAAPASFPPGPLASDGMIRSTIASSSADWSGVNADRRATPAAVLEAANALPTLAVPIPGTATTAPTTAPRFTSSRRDSPPDVAA